MKNIIFIVLALFVVFENNAKNIKSPVKSFELRYVTSDTIADGETDFKGSTEYFSTEQRIEYLRNYFSYASSYFSDNSMSKKVVDDSELDSALNKIKPQPLPDVRKKIPLKDWDFITSRIGQDLESINRISSWKRFSGVSLKQGCLSLDKDYKLPISIEEQSWRFNFTALLKGSDYELCFYDSVTSKKVLSIRVGGDYIEYVNNGIKEKIKIPDTSGFRKLKFEFDLQSGIKRYNFYLNNDKIIAFKHLSDTTSCCVNKIILSASKNLKVNQFYGVGYHLTPDIPIDLPYVYRTYIDENFKSHPSILHWNDPNYEPVGWSKTDLPVSHGSERYAGEDIYLRKHVYIPDKKKVWLEIESIAPSGELWVNGKVVEVIKNPHPNFIDITDYVKANSDNLISIKVNHYEASRKEIMHHTPTDLNIGWYAGRINLHLTDNVYIKDVFFSTLQLSGNTAKVNAKVTIENTDYRFFDGSLSVNMSKWFPVESNVKINGKSIIVGLEPQEEKVYDLCFTVTNPELWTADNPNLYKVQVLLDNLRSGLVYEKYRAIDGDAAKTDTLNVNKHTDDYVLTTGIRTVSQENGVFRINGKPELLKAPLLFGPRFPIESMSARLRCADTRDLLEELIMIKKMNANGVRMSVHWTDNCGIDGTNDSRLVEMGDQLGIMFIWTTGSFIRVRTPFTMDFEGLKKYILQVRNSPSIVIWQPSNHPDIPKWNEAMAFYRKVYNIIYPLDSTRLISPSADLRHIGPHNDLGTVDRWGNKVSSCDPIWTADKIVRGSMDYPTGFGQTWDYLRMWPFPKNWKGNVPINDYLQSKYRAYFNFEQEESIGQPNWKLHEGLPTYKYHSYEWDYDIGSIGRRLSTSEWKESQAWQAFSAYEAIRKMRWLDYDGLCWCCMVGGPNTGTYQKPLVDLLGTAKLSYYTSKMAFQPMLAGSHDVDIVYGPNDSPQVVLINVGDGYESLDVIVTIKDINGHKINTQRFKNVNIEAGRTCKILGDLHIPKLKDGFYVFEYTIL